jgi:hypothetical protein
MNLLETVCNFTQQQLLQSHIQKGCYLNSVTDQSPPTLCTDSVEDKKTKTKQQQLTYLHHNNNSNKTETTKFFTSVPKHDQN